MSDLFAPEDGWRVRILDLSAPAEDTLVEEVAGFATLMHANAFARAYVQDSIERCRRPGATPGEVLEAWRAFGEDAEIAGDADGAWHSDPELGDMADNPAGDEARDWRAIDPRRIGDNDEPDDEAGDQDP